MCLAAVQQDGQALEFVEEQTEEICITAIRQNAWASEFVKDNGDASSVRRIFLAMVQRDGLSLEQVQNFGKENPESGVDSESDVETFPTPELQQIRLAAVQQNGLALQFINEQKDVPNTCNETVSMHQICLAAVKQNGLALRFVSNKTEEICVAAVSNIKALLFV